MKKKVTPYIGSHLNDQIFETTIEPFDDTIHITKEPIDFKHEIGELLCVIHGDGGHYIEEHGMKKAIEDAHKEYYKLRQKAEKNS